MLVSSGTLFINFLCRCSKNKINRKQNKKKEEGTQASEEHIADSAYRIPTVDVPIKATVKTPA